MNNVIPTLVFFLLTSINSISQAAVNPSITLSNCEVTADWHGGLEGIIAAMRGNNAIQWDISHSKTVSTDFGEIALNNHKEIHMWLHANHPHATGESIALTLSSENEATPGSDYYLLSIPINWTGWKKIIIPLEQFKDVREPLGFDRIGSMALNADGWGNSPDNSLVMHIDMVEAIDYEDPVGPIISDNDLFSSLNLAFPGLEGVRAAVAKTDWNLAKSELCEYMRRRTQSRWFDTRGYSDVAKEQIIANANDLVNGTFTIIGHTYTFPNRLVDWSYNATEHTISVPYSPEWLFGLSAFEFWEDLSLAYLFTGDSVYAETFVAHLQGFIATRPVPSFMNNNESSSWRTLNTAIRLNGLWQNAFNRFLDAAAFDNEAMFVMLKSFIEHGRYLRKYQTSGNWKFSEALGLFSTGAFFPEFKEASDWRIFASSLMCDEMQYQYLSDGGHFSLSPAYHSWTLKLASKLYETALVTEHTGDIPTNYLKSLKQAYYWLANISTPSGDTPKLNDSAPNLDVGYILNPARKYFPEDQFIRYIVSDKQEGIPPHWKSIFLEGTGHIVFRSDWNIDSHYALLDVGPMGFGHEHQDKLNFLLYPYGRRLLYDNGGGAYETSSFRDYAIDTFAHNTILVDNLPQNRLFRYEGREEDILGAGTVTEPRPLFYSTDEFDYAQGRYQNGYGIRENVYVTHRREIVYLKPDLFFAIDTLDPSDSRSHYYQARWHLLTTNYHFDKSNNIVETTDSNLPNLLIIPLDSDNLTTNIDSGARTPELLGWNLGTSLNQHFPALTVRHQKEGSGRQHFITLLQPLNIDQTSPIANLEKIDNKYIISFTDNRILTFSIKIQSNERNVFTITDSQKGDKPIVIDPNAAKGSFWDLVLPAFLNNKKEQ